MGTGETAVSGQAAAPREAGIDAGRFLAFIGVVLIHIADMGSPAGFWGAAFGRFAVPMFFMVSGYFIGETEPYVAKIGRYSRRLLPLFAFWAALYLIAYAAWPHSTREWALLLIKGGRGNHLWFIPSLWLCLVTALILLHFVGLRLALLVAGALYAAGLLIGSYAPLVGLEQSAWNPRDGITFGLLPVMAGYALRRRPIAIRPAPAAILFGVLSAVNMTEYWLVLQLHPRYTEFFITTPLVAFMAFSLARAWQPRGALAGSMSRLGRLSLGFYAIHMFFVNLCKLLLPHNFLGWAASLPLVVAMSVASTHALARWPALRRFLQ